MARIGTTNISTAVVGQMLNAASNDVGTLCTHSAINKWSRWKPIRANNTVGITEADIITAKGGLAVPAVYGYPAIMSYYRNNPGFVFAYNKPRGLTYNEPFRLGDFRNYDTAAEIFYDFVVPEHAFSTLINIRLYTYLPGEAGTGLEYWLDWELLGLETLYFGIIVVKKDQTTSYNVYFADTPLSVGGVLNDNILIQEYLTPAPLEDTQYDVFAFLGDNPGENDPSTYLFNLLEAGHFVLAYSKEMTILGTAEYMGGGVEYDINITNRTTANITLISAELLFRYADNGIDDELEPLEPLELLVSLSNVVVPTTGLSLCDSISSILTELPTRGGYIYFRNTSHAYLNTIIQITYS